MRITSVQRVNRLERKWSVKGGKSLTSTGFTIDLYCLGNVGWGLKNVYVLMPRLDKVRVTIKLNIESKIVSVSAPSIIPNARAIASKVANPPVFVSRRNLYSLGEPSGS